MESSNASDTWAAASDEFSTQWLEPSDIFSVLLILGGDVIQLALAALTGGLLTPVAFSFGWVAYAISAVLSAVGDNRLVNCAPEVPLKVFNLRSGYRRDNRSWLLGRLIKTYDYWMAPEVRARLRHDPRADEELGHGLVAGPATPPVVALCVAVYRWREGATPGVPSRDLVWWSGFVVSAVQLGVAAVPFGRRKDWAIFLATACGTLLSYASASLPQWRREKWHARRTKKDVALTLGNGSQHVVVILGADHGLDLEDLSAGRAPDLWSTRVWTLALAVCWLVLLITCTGIKTHTWYLLAVGGLGMLHNIVVAGAPRRPAAMGLPIELVKTTTTLENGEVRVAGEIFAEPKVMWTLMELEEKYEGHGKALVDEFFPGKLRSWEDTWWASNDSSERRRLLRQAQEDERQKALKKQREAVQANPVSL